MLDDIIAKALERDIDQRFASAKEMRDALEAYIADEGSVRTEEIGVLMASIFSEVREKTRRQVRAQLAEISLMRPPSSLTRLRARDGGVIDLSEAQEMSGNTGNSRPRTVEGLNISIVRKSDPPLHRKGAFLTGVGAALAVGGLAFGAFTWRASRLSVGAAAPAQPGALVAPPAAPAAGRGRSPPPDQ